jgi:hypothetical protein
MRFRRIAGIVIIVLVIAGVYRLIARQQRSVTSYFQAHRSKSISEDVQQAKDQGLSEIHLPLPKITGPEAENINDILQVDSVVVARLTGKETTFLDVDKKVIVTWLRFELVDHIAGPTLPFLQLPSKAPEKLKKTSAQQTFLVRVFGGTLYEAGVKVISDSTLAELPVDEKYVLFLFIDHDASEALAGLNFGPQGVIPIDNRGKVGMTLGSPHDVITMFLVENKLADLTSLTNDLKTRASALGR